MYPEHLVAPMREELTSIGFNELKTAEAVDAFMKEHKGTSLVMINSVCGCAAGAARPGVAMSLDTSTKNQQNSRPYLPVLILKRLLK